jgi:hypothetical protein
VRELTEDAPGKFATIVCRWCTNGGMTPQQLERWLERQKKRTPPV